jgi:hypothetical protein
MVCCVGSLPLLLELLSRLEQSILKLAPLHHLHEHAVRNGGVAVGASSCVAQHCDINLIPVAKQHEHFLCPAMQLHHRKEMGLVENPAADTHDRLYVSADERFALKASRFSRVELT